jgi:ADP-ribose pyrophosphatase YjhB (NUDIX family)
LTIGTSRVPRFFGAAAVLALALRRAGIGVAYGTHRLMTRQPVRGSIPLPFDFVRVDEDDEEAGERPTARILLIGPGDRVLLFRWVNPEGPAVWFTPGGGVEPGETYEEAARRELKEGVGLRGLDLGPCVWVRSHGLLQRDEQTRLRERFFVVHAPTDAVDTSGFTHDERDVITGHRWMTVDEIAELHDPVAPRRLAELLPDILAGRYPDPPLDVGI